MVEVSLVDFLIYVPNVVLHDHSQLDSRSVKNIRISVAPVQSEGPGSIPAGGKNIFCVLLNYIPYKMNRFQDVCGLFIHKVHREPHF